jgi:ribonuclease D
MTGRYDSEPETPPESPDGDQMSQAELIADQPAFEAFLRRLREEPVLAVDTEAATFHRYTERIYLIQVSTRTATAIIDPLAVADLAGLGPLLSGPGVEVVFHDAGYDLRLLGRQYGFRIGRLFDTRAAAELAGEPGLSLAALLAQYFHIGLDKRLQRADWSVRPLTAEMLEYAAGDTSHLIALRDILAARLEAAGRMEWAEEEFERLATMPVDGDDRREPAWLRLKGARTLDPRRLAVVREVHAWRADLAARLDRAEFRILGNEALLLLARGVPDTLDALAQVPGVGRGTVARHGEALLGAIRRALATPPEDLPRLERPPRRPREPEVETRIGRLKEARARCATDLALAPGVVCPNSVLEAVARACPRDLEALAALPELRRWQVAAVGPVLLEALRTP